jgi:hypothetical protein
MLLAFIQKQALMLATNDIAWGAIWIFGILIVVVWFCAPGKIRGRSRGRGVNRQLFCSGKKDICYSDM